MASSTAKIGSPAVTVPNKGILSDGTPNFERPKLVNSIARGLLGSRWM